VPRAGLEPARPFGLGILSPLCLPFHHRGNCVFAGVLRVTPRFRRAWIHFWQHLLPRETLRNETIETWTIHERLGGSQHADWLFIATGWRPLCAQFRATDQARRKSKGVMAGIGFMTIAAWGGHKYGGRRTSDRESLRPPYQRASEGNCSQRRTECHFRNADERLGMNWLNMACGFNHQLRPVRRMILL
jgi:hypothetical protein